MEKYSLSASKTDEFLTVYYSIDGELEAKKLIKQSYDLYFLNDLLYNDLEDDFKLIVLLRMITVMLITNKFIDNMLLSFLFSDHCNEEMKGIVIQFSDSVGGLFKFHKIEKEDSPLNILSCQRIKDINIISDVLKCNDFLDLDDFEKLKLPSSILQYVFNPKYSKITGYLLELIDRKTGMNIKGQNALSIGQKNIKRLLFNAFYENIDTSIQLCIFNRYRDILDYKSEEFLKMNPEFKKKLLLHLQYRPSLIEFIAINDPDGLVRNIFISSVRRKSVLTKIRDNDPIIENRIKALDLITENKELF